jgi:hypothetical protein
MTQAHRSRALLAMSAWNHGACSVGSTPCVAITTKLADPVT